MTAFVEAYPEFLIVKQPAAQLTMNQKVQQLSAQIPWAHHQVILDKVKLPQESSPYIKKIIENGWSRNILSAQIESGFHRRQGKPISILKLHFPKCNRSGNTANNKIKGDADAQSLTNLSKKKGITLTESHVNIGRWIETFKIFHIVLCQFFFFILSE